MLSEYSSSFAGTRGQESMLVVHIKLNQDVSRFEAQERRISRPLLYHPRGYERDTRLILSSYYYFRRLLLAAAA